MWFDLLDHWQTFAAGVFTVGRPSSQAFLRWGRRSSQCELPVSRSAGKLKLCACRWRWKYGVSSTHASDA
jgi:hypothetical protein